MCSCNDSGGLTRGHIQDEWKISLELCVNSAFHSQVTLITCLGLFHNTKHLVETEENAFYPDVQLMAEEAEHLCTKIAFYQMFHSLCLETSSGSESRLPQGVRSTTGVHIKTLYVYQGEDRWTFITPGLWGTHGAAVLPYCLYK